MSDIQLLLNIHRWVFYNVVVVWTYVYVSCTEALFACILIAITRNLSGNRSQTPISSSKMHNPRVGVQFQNTPYVCILKSLWRLSLAVSEIVTDHIRSSLCITTTHRRAKVHCTNMRASVCKYAVACGFKFLHVVASGCQAPPWETPLDHIHSHLLTYHWSEILAGIGSCSRVSVPAVARIRKWAAAIASFRYVSIASITAQTCNLCSDWSLERCSARLIHSARTHVCGWLAGCAHMSRNVSTCTFTYWLWFVQHSTQSTGVRFHLLAHR